MARSLIGGLVARGQRPGGDPCRRAGAELREALARDFGVTVLDDNAQAAVAGAALWVLAVKPQVMRRSATRWPRSRKPRARWWCRLPPASPAAQLAALAGRRHRRGPHHAQHAGPARRRAPPGCLPMPQWTPAQRDSAEALMQATGITAWIDDEALMDAVTAVSGSGPAYVFLLAEAMQAAGEAQGLPAETAARAGACRPCFGAARMLTESGEPAARAAPARDLARRHHPGRAGDVRSRRFPPAGGCRDRRRHAPWSRFVRRQRLTATRSAPPPPKVDNTSGTPARRAVHVPMPSSEPGDWLK